jgi:hypothetical protein
LDVREDQKLQVIEVSGSLSGRYQVREERADGSLVIVPDTSIQAIRERHGSRQASAQEIEDFVGQLPTDDEG